MLCQERRVEIDLPGLARAAAALDSLSSRRPAESAALSAVGQRAGLNVVARVFTN
jgi:hypothetical protein